MGKVRIGVIGVGSIGTVHTKAYAKVPDAEVVAMCDILPDRLKAKAAEFGIPLEPASRIPASLVSDSRAAFECRLVGQTEAGDHVFYLAEILACRGDAAVKQVFAWDGYARLGTV